MVKLEYKVHKAHQEVLAEGEKEVRLVNGELWVNPVYKVLEVKLELKAGMDHL